jgi:hypothetical protein
LSLINKAEYNGYVIHPKSKIIYLYDSADGDNIKYDHPVMDAGAWMAQTQGEGLGSKAASVTQSQDPLSLVDVFYDTKIPHQDQTFSDLANAILTERKQSTINKDRSRAASVITSKDFGSFQNLVILGETNVRIRTGILTGLFEEVATPNLGGKWATFDDGVKYYTNVPEGTTVEPSGGTGSLISIFVPKHEGAVAITYRAQAIINGDNPFQRLTGQLQDARANKENAMTADEIESNTAHSETGVDFGDRSGSPPASDTNPVSLWNALIGDFDALNKGKWDLFISKSFIFNEYITNDIVRGVNNPIPTQTNVNEGSGPIPGLSGVTWARDNEISTSTAGWAMDSDAIKVFRGPTTAYTVSNQDTETTKNVLRSYMLVETVDSDLIYTVTGIAA